MAEGEEPFNRNFYVPKILPEWKNTCHVQEIPKQETKVELTNENAGQYADIASNVGWKGRVNYALDHLEEDSDFDASFLNSLLESLISTIIVLAGDGSPPDDYYITSIAFLQCVCDEFGEHPPNVAAFLQYLKAKASNETRATLESIATAENDEKLSPNLVISTIPKSVQQMLSHLKRN